ncbi:MAG TPA: hypothetical protein VF290_03095 [Pyrinomonadaceae bacterium]
MSDDLDDAGERHDNPFLRSEVHLDRLGIPSSVFLGVLDDAIVHASDPARADAPAVALPWIPMGPRNVGGRINALAQDPREPATIYAGSGIGGIWKTVNGGDTWKPLDDFRPPDPPNVARQALPIGAIAIAPSDRSVIYVGTGEPTLGVNSTTGAIIDYEISGTGLYRSTDSGTIFNMIDRVDPGPIGAPPSVIGARRFERILVDPWEPSRLWIACPKGLWRGEPPPAIAPPGSPPVFSQDVITPGAPVAASQDASDIVIDFGGRSGARDFNPATDPPSANFTVYVALRSVGIFRRTFNRATAAYTGAWELLSEGIDEVNFHRIKLALCAARPEFLYAVFALRDQTASRVYKSTNRGTRWEKTAVRADDDGKQAWYDLIVEVHPERPEIVFTGSVEVFRSVNAGESWQKVLVWTNYDKGDRAQHADQHALLFDGLDPRKIWVGNDGGISMSRNLGTTWRKRSHGILATQFYDITVHPQFPFIMGGGLQDNGTWVSFGGPTWYHIFGADGGAMAFDPTTPQSFLATWQGPMDGRQHGLMRCVVNSSTGAMGTSSSEEYLSPLPDVPLVPFVAPATPFTKMKSVYSYLTTGFQANHTATFVGVLEHHPSRANHAIVGRKQGAYLTINGVAFSLLNTGAFAPVTAEVSTVAYAPSSPDTEWWIGTSRGQVFRTTSGAIAAPGVPLIVWVPVVLPALGARWISDIAIHPTDSRIVAVTVAGSPGRVYLTGDRGVTWHEISGRAILPTGPPSPAADQLSPSPITCVAFDPQSPALGAAQTLYVGTLAGVYVIRNATPPVAAAPAPPAPVWRTFNNNLPLVLIQDIATMVERDAGGNITRTALRCATLGRGIYECDLAGTPAARLYIRKIPIDDGRTYFGPAVLPNDPRQLPMPPFTTDQAFDIRVDAPPFNRLPGVTDPLAFEEVMDGVEFDEDLRHDNLVPGERNLVYVQVHNGGTDTLDDVQVHLFFADAAAAPAGAAWQAVGPPIPLTVGPAQPAVARFEWTPPSNVPNPVALLACCSHVPHDTIPALPPASVDPANPALSIGAERRAALRIVAVTPFVGDVYIRDGIDDDGRAGSVAWGTRSPDILVKQTPELFPDVEFSDLGDRHAADKVKGGVTNHIYVRVHNRRGVPLSASVDLFRVPFDTMHQGNTWIQIGATVAVDDIPANGWKFAPVIEFANPADPDPSPSHPYKVFLLVAIVSRGDDAAPARNAITNQDLFWRFFLRDQVGNNAAMRALRFESS